MDIRNTWQQVSIRSKTLVWLSAVTVLMLIMMAISASMRNRVMVVLNRLQENDTRCYTVQDALNEEREALELLLHTRSQTDLQSYTEACTASAQALDALPVGYENLGEERSARTWNLQNGYSGYREYRDALVAMDPSDPDFSAAHYRVLEMLEDLSVYALRLGQVTLEQGSEVYRRTIRNYQILPLFSMLLLALTILASSAIFNLFDKSLIRPILQMSTQSRRIAENDFSLPDLQSRSSDEVGELIQAFNRMKHATRDHITTLEEKNRIESDLHRQQLERLELEQNLDHTRLEMLKSQVNPHFLFNTLNLISCMARLEDAPDTDRMILSLSGIFRYNLRTKEQVVLLEQELEALQDYIHIQQTRFDGRIAYSKQILVDPMQVSLPSFTLQPIVENAFIHGLSRREENGRILLRIWQEEDVLVVSVADNGAGMTPEQLAQLQQRMQHSEQTGRGIGLGNISRRISMLYPEGDLRIYSKPNRGTVIQCLIPQKARGEEDCIRF
ncbi:MAG: sensor histidine kinase [Oscillospiraceae bacterium]|nr:sensor histidine kinase [Oscillospiraceae bacterium]